MITGRKLACITALGLAAVAAGGAVQSAPVPGAERNWAEWRGPLNTGVSPTAEPPTTWSENSNIKWKVKLPGSGTSTPIIWENRVYVTTAVAAGGPPKVKEGGGPTTLLPTGPYRFMVMCLDRATGKTVWEKVAREEVPHEGHHQDHGYASHSPVTDGKNLYVYFGSRGLYCYDLQGNLKWKKDLGKQQTRLGFGEGSSPALHGNTLVITWDHEGEDFIVALDKYTGAEKWRQQRDEPTTWSTPLILEHGGKAQVVTAGTRKVRTYDLETGKLVWEIGGLTENVIPSPVSSGDMVYLTSGYRGNALLAVRLGREGDLTGTDAVAWSHNRSTPYVPSPLLYDDKLYFIGSNSGMVSCFDAKTGQPLMNAERLPALSGIYASPVGAAGKVYLLGRNGASVVLKNTGKMDVLATNTLEDGFEASPAVAGKELFLRGRQNLYCVAEK